MDSNEITARLIALEAIAFALIKYLTPDQAEALHQTIRTGAERANENTSNAALGTQTRDELLKFCDHPQT